MMCLTEKRYCPLNPIPQPPPRCRCHRHAAATAAKLPLPPPPPLPSFSSSLLALSSSPFPSPLPPPVLVDCWLLSMPSPSLSPPVSSKNRVYILDRVLLMVALFFCPKIILPPTTTSDPPPLPWCEPNTQLKNVFLVLLGLSDGFRWFLDFGRGTLELVELWQYMLLIIT
jgi:hypothetical protein